jgi:CRISPR-associated protein Cmr4
MYKAKTIVYIYVETPLHAGSGRGLGAVDLPIQRERSTGYPMVQSSSLKGCLRSESEPHGEAGKDEWLAIFGPDTDQADEYSGALSVGDARLLLFPMRSLAGVFAWATSLDVLSRFKRDLAITGQTLEWSLPDHASIAEDCAWVNGENLLAGQKLVLEEYSFSPDPSQSALIHSIGEWLAAHALPDLPEYSYWKEKLPTHLCLLPQDAFRDFTLYSTEVQTHVRILPETKTVQRGALWTTECLPTDCLLYAPLLATQSRKPGINLQASQIIQKVMSYPLSRTQLGGDETTGQGMVALRFGGVA